MKNIESILKDAGIELTAEQTEAVNKAVGENYKPIADYLKQKDKVTSLEASLNETKDALKAFDGVDADALKNQIATLEQTIKDNETDYNNKLKERDFDDMLTSAIAEAKGINKTAIKALLNIDELRASNNQKEDLSAQLKALAEAEDSKMLFTTDATEIGAGNPIGSFSGAATGLTGIEKAFYEKTGIKID